MKMRMMMLAAIAATLTLSPMARAADVGAPVFKAAPIYVPPAVSCTPQNCSGFYVGGAVEGNGSNADIIGVGLNQSVFSEGVAVKIVGGYQFWSGSTFAALELSAGYEFSTPGTSGIVPGGNKFVGEELAKLGYNFFPQATSATTTPSQSPSLLTVPADLLASSTPYLAFGGMQRLGKTIEVSGAGVQTVIAKGWSTDAKYLYAPAQQGLPATQVVELELLKHF